MPKPSALVRITWTDSVTYGGWKHDTDIDQWMATTPVRMESVGYLIRETPEFIVLAGGRTIRGEELQYNCLAMIPKVAVEKREELE